MFVRRQPDIISSIQIKRELTGKLISLVVRPEYSKTTPWLVTCWPLASCVYWQPSWWFQRGHRSLPPLGKSTYHREYTNVEIWLKSTNVSPCCVTSAWTFSLYQERCLFPACIDSIYWFICIINCPRFAPKSSVTIISRHMRRGVWVDDGFGFLSINFELM